MADPSSGFVVRSSALSSLRPRRGVPDLLVLESAPTAPSAKFLVTIGAVE